MTSKHNSQNHFNINYTVQTTENSVKLLIIAQAFIFPNRQLHWLIFEGVFTPGKSDCLLALGWTKLFFFIFFLVLFAFTLLFLQVNQNL